MSAHESKLMTPETVQETRLFAFHTEGIKTLLTRIIDEIDALTEIASMTSKTEVEPLMQDGSINMYAEVRRFESALIRQALMLTGGHQGHAAALLGVKLTTLNSKIIRYRIPTNSPIRLHQVPTR